MMRYPKTGQKERICCALFFLFLPLCQLLMNFSVPGVLIFLLTGAAIVLRLGVFSPEKEALSVTIGWGITLDCIAFLGIAAINALPLAWEQLKLGRFKENGLSVLLVCTLLLLLRVLLLHPTWRTVRGAVIWILLDNTLLFGWVIALLYSGLLMRRQFLPEYQTLLGLWICFLLLDFSGILSQLAQQMHRKLMGAQAVMYLAVLIATVLNTGFSSRIWLSEIFAAFGEAVHKTGLWMLIPMLYALCVEAICFTEKTQHSTLARLYAALLFTASPLIPMIIAGETYGYGVLAVLVGAWLWLGWFHSEDGEHSEYGLVIVGSAVWLCVPLLHAKYWIAAGIFAALLIGIWAIFRQSKERFWRVLLGWNAMILGAAGVNLVVTVANQGKWLAVCLTAAASLAALNLCGVSAKRQRYSFVLLSVIGVAALLLQLLICTRMF